MWNFEGEVKNINHQLMIQQSCFYQYPNIASISELSRIL